MGVVQKEVGVAQTDEKKMAFVVGQPTLSHSTVEVLLSIFCTRCRGVGGVNHSICTRCRGCVSLIQFAPVVAGTCELATYLHL